jgi:hypothetical protein
MKKSLTLFALFLLFLVGCQKNESDTSKNLPPSKPNVPETAPEAMQKGTFGYDVAFLRNFQKDLITLQNADGSAKVLLSPALQARVMTSTAEGDTGSSFGWINYGLFEKGIQKGAHIHPFGGEERFWIGPEGGQFSVFFKKGVEFVFDNWFTPAALDTEPFEVVSTAPTQASFKRDIALTNYSGNDLKMRINRDIMLIDGAEMQRVLGVAPDAAVKVVAYKTVNTMTNTGTNEWTKQSGMPSMWLLGMLNSSPTTTVAIPIKKGDEKTLGIPVNDDYFGKVEASRLKTGVGAGNDVVYFKADGQKRGKIGISPKRVMPFAGSYDSQTGVLTLIHCDIPAGASDYVNSAWKHQDNPFAGDVINSYNDGKLADGTQLGPFYELEASSPAINLKPNASTSFSQHTFHLKGSPAQLDAITQKVLGVSIQDITNAFK